MNLLYSFIQMYWFCPYDSYNEYKYFILFIDDYFKIIWLYLMKNKSVTLFIFKNSLILYKINLTTRLKPLEPIMEWSL
jgi:hypothetical protein